jgi:RNA polymerase sigma-70 factor (ECF subfamily)
LAALDTRAAEIPHLIFNSCRETGRRVRVNADGFMPMPMTSDSPTDTFAKLFTESRQALHRYIQRFVRSSETAKEIVQEAFLRTYRQRESVDTLRAFLFSTARNLAANEIRHRRTVERDNWRSFDDDTGFETENESLESQFLRDERNRLFQQAIDRLPAQCRAAFTLRVFHEYSYKEVAEHLGISVKTVEKHISRGIRETNHYLKVRYSVTGRRHG